MSNIWAAVDEENTIKDWSWLIVINHRRERKKEEKSLYEENLSRQTLMLARGSLARKFEVVLKSWSVNVLRPCSLSRQKEQQRTIEGHRMNNSENNK